MTERRTRKWIWGAGILLPLVVLGLFSLNKLSSGIPVRTAETVEGTIQSFIEARARTSLPHTYHVTMPMQGRVLPIEVHEGDLVEKGDVLARLDDSDWQDATRETVDIIRAVDNWVEATEAQVKAGKIRHDYAKWEWEADAKLLESSFVSEKQERDSKRRYLDSAVKIEESVSMLQMSLAVQSIVGYLPGFVKRNLDRTVVSSPVTGTILKRYVWNEKVMTPGEPLLDIGNLEELEITAEILTVSAISIQPGDRVEIYGEPFGTKTLNGTVRLVEPEAYTKISSLGVEEQRVDVKITFDEEALDALHEDEKRLGLHYRVRVRIITDEKHASLIIPRTALFHGNQGEWQLYTIIKGAAQLKTVEVGLENEYEAEITAGLETGDVVILAPESSISHGTKVDPSL